VAASGQDPDLRRFDVDRQPVPIPLDFECPIVALGRLGSQQRQARVYPVRHGVEGQAGLVRVTLRRRAAFQRQTGFCSQSN
jgi:hypothetical protein